jgi:hypothetical protein
MTQEKKNIIIGYIILFVIVAIPVAFILGPIVFVGFAVGVFIGLSKKGKKGTPKTNDRKQQDEELITVILPTIDPKN